MLKSSVKRYLIYIYGRSLSIVNVVNIVSACYAMRLSSEQTAFCFLGNAMNCIQVRK